ncbi:Fumarylacetoacetate hydrolase domain-containing protein 2 [Rhizoclosmatium hyalinum]|nr:Fumarylacetoacetate hydrolase domain-containing protein 2 [Rhizoclosmatium hyalinum]
MIEDPDALTLWLKVNDTVKQNGPTSDMIFKIPQLISYVSSIMTLERGDVILTGTPAGVGRMNPGDIVTCGLRTAGSDRDIFNMKFSVVERPGIGLYGNGR